MRFSILAIASLVAFTAALPQREGRGRIRGGRPGQNAQGDGVEVGQPISSPLPAAQLPAVAPGNAQDGNQGAANQVVPTDRSGLNNQGVVPDQKGAGAGNNADNGQLPNDQSNQNGQGQDNQNQNGQNQNGQNQNGQNQNGQNQNGQTPAGTFDPSLVPEFGIQAGQNPDGTGNCAGLNNVKIPCSCPPDRQAFIQRVQAAAAAGNSEGVPISFPLDDSSASKKARIGASIIVLQNLNGKGVGCPAAATTFLQQQAAA